MSNHAGSGRRRRRQFNPNSWSNPTISKRTNILCLGMSYPCVRSQIRAAELSPDVKLFHPDESVEQAVELVRRNILTEMDGRDLARCLAMEASNDTLVYTVSMEHGATYSKRHMTANFNRQTFIRDIKRFWGKVKFRQVVLDYFWIPSGSWVMTHWKRSFFNTTLPSFVKEDLLDLDGDEGAIYLPFCLHCIGQVVASQKILSKYYTISFLYKHELPEHALWMATSTISPEAMQSWLGKAINQEEIYCTFTANEVYNSTDDAFVRKDDLLKVLRSIEDFVDVRMIKLKALRTYDTDRSQAVESTQNGEVITKRLETQIGGFVGLRPHREVMRGLDKPTGSRRSQQKQKKKETNNPSKIKELNGKSKGMNSSKIKNANNVGKVEEKNQTFKTNTPNSLPKTMSSPKTHDEGGSSNLPMAANDSSKTKDINRIKKQTKNISRENVGNDAPNTKNAKRKQKKGETGVAETQETNHDVEIKVKNSAPQTKASSQRNKELLNDAPIMEKVNDLAKTKKAINDNESNDSIKMKQSNDTTRKKKVNESSKLEKASAKKKEPEKQNLTTNEHVTSPKSNGIKSIRTKNSQSMLNELDSTPKTKDLGAAQNLKKDPGCISSLTNVDKLMVTRRQGSISRRKTKPRPVKRNKPIKVGSKVNVCTRKVQSRKNLNLGKLDSEANTAVGEKPGKDPENAKGQYNPSSKASDETSTDLLCMSDPRLLPSEVDLSDVSLLNSASDDNCVYQGRNVVSPNTLSNDGGSVSGASTLDSNLTEKTNAGFEGEENISCIESRSSMNNNTALELKEDNRPDIINQKSERIPPGFTSMKKAEEALIAGGCQLGNSSTNENAQTGRISPPSPTETIKSGNKNEQHIFFEKNDQVKQRYTYILLHYFDLYKKKKAPSTREIILNIIKYMSDIHSPPIPISSVIEQKVARDFKCMIVALENQKNEKESRSITEIKGLEKKLPVFAKTAQKEQNQRVCSSQNIKHKIMPKSSALVSDSPPSMHRTTSKSRKSGIEDLVTGEELFDDKCSSESQKTNASPLSDPKNINETLVLSEANIEAMNLKQKLSVVIETMSTLKPSKEMVVPLLVMHEKLKKYSNLCKGANVEEENLSALKNLGDRCKHTSGEALSLLKSRIDSPSKPPEYPQCQHKIDQKLVNPLQSAVPSKKFENVMNKVEKDNSTHILSEDMTHENKEKEEQANRYMATMYPKNQHCKEIMNMKKPQVHHHKSLARNDKPPQSLMSTTDHIDDNVEMKAKPVLDVLTNKKDSANQKDLSGICSRKDNVSRLSSPKKKPSQSLEKSSRHREYLNKIVRRFEAAKSITASFPDTDVGTSYQQYMLRNPRCRASPMVKINNKINVNKKNVLQEGVEAKVFGSNITTKLQPRRYSNKDIDDKNNLLLSSEDPMVTQTNIDRADCMLADSSPQINPRPKSQDETLPTSGKHQSHKQKLLVYDTCLLKAMLKYRLDEDDIWAQCDECSKWRYLPFIQDSRQLPKYWHCGLNATDPKRRHCDAPEQDESSLDKERWGKIVEEFNLGKYRLSKLKKRIKDDSFLKLLDHLRDDQSPQDNINELLGDLCGYKACMKSETPEASSSAEKTAGVAASVKKLDPQCDDNDSVSSTEHNQRTSCNDVSITSNMTQDSTESYPLARRFRAFCTDYNQGDIDTSLSDHRKPSNNVSKYEKPELETCAPNKTRLSQQPKEISLSKTMRQHQIVNRRGERNLESSEIDEIEPKDKNLTQKRFHILEGKHNKHNEIFKQDEEKINKLASPIKQDDAPSEPFEGMNDAASVLMGIRQGNVQLSSNTMKKSPEVPLNSKLMNKNETNIRQSSTLIALHYSHTEAKNIRPHASKIKSGVGRARKVDSEMNSFGQCHNQASEGKPPSQSKTTLKPVKKAATSLHHVNHLSDNMQNSKQASMCVPRAKNVKPLKKRSKPATKARQDSKMSQLKNGMLHDKTKYVQQKKSCVASKSVSHSQPPFTTNMKATTQVQPSFKRELKAPVTSYELCSATAQEDSNENKLRHSANTISKTSAALKAIKSKRNKTSRKDQNDQTTIKHSHTNKKRKISDRNNHFNSSTQNVGVTATMNTDYMPNMRQAHVQEYPAVNLMDPCTTRHSDTFSLPQMSQMHQTNERHFLSYPQNQDINSSLATAAAMQRIDWARYASHFTARPSDIPQSDLFESMTLRHLEQERTRLSTELFSSFTNDSVWNEQYETPRIRIADDFIQGGAFHSDRSSYEHGFIYSNNCGLDLRDQERALYNLNSRQIENLSRNQHILAQQQILQNRNVRFVIDEYGRPDIYFG